MMVLILLLVPVLLLVVLLAVLAVVGFNRLRSQDVRADEALGGIDDRLTRRADLIPDLVDTVKGYAAHEKGVLEEVIEARARVARVTADGTVAEKSAAQGALDQALVNVMALAEAYPDLLAGAGFLQLQQQLAETEHQLSFARQSYNDAAATVNTSVRTVPWMFFSGIAGVRERVFYDAPAGRDQPPTVES